jgi:hypothetical protein
MNTIDRNPEDEAVAKALLRALLEIHIYQSEHTKDELKQASIEALTATGLFSPQTTAFIASHQVRFYGFPHRLARDIAVLDIVAAGKRFVGFSDGHVELEALENDRCRAIQSNPE